MGGDGSGRWGRRSPQRFVDEVPEVLHASSARRWLESSPVPLVSDQMPVGGTRWYVVCPSCGVRRTKLYRESYGALWGCRACLGLRYRSQSSSKRDRLRNRAARLYARVGGEREDGTFRKPRGMHRRTFHRLVDEAEDLECEAFLLEPLIRKLARVG